MLDPNAFAVINELRKRAFSPSPAVAQAVMGQAQGGPPVDPAMMVNGGGPPPGMMPGPGGPGGPPPGAGGPPPGDPSAGGMPPGAPPGAMPPPGGDPAAGPPQGALPPELQQAITQAVQQAMAGGAPGAPGAGGKGGGKQDLAMAIAHLTHKMSVIEKSMRPMADALGIQVPASELWDMAPPTPPAPGAAPGAPGTPGAAPAPGAPPPSNVAQALPQLPPAAAKTASAQALWAVMGLAKMAAPIPPGGSSTSAPASMGVAKPISKLKGDYMPKPNQSPGDARIDLGAAQNQALPGDSLLDFTGGTNKNPDGTHALVGNHNLVTFGPNHNSVRPSERFPGTIERMTDTSRLPISEYKGPYNWLNSQPVPVPEAAEARPLGGSVMPDQIGYEKGSAQKLSHDIAQINFGYPVDPKDGVPPSAAGKSVAALASLKSRKRG